MGRGGRGGRYSPNEDRSRSMNSQDVCGRAAMVNEARQGGDDVWDDGYDDDVQSKGVVVKEPKYDNSHWGVYRDEPKKPKEPAVTNADLGFYGPLMHMKIKPEDKIHVFPSHDALVVEARTALPLSGGVKCLRGEQEVEK